MKSRSWLTLPMAFSFRILEKCVVKKREKRKATSWLRTNWKENDEDKIKLVSGIVIFFLGYTFNLKDMFQDDKEHIYLSNPKDNLEDIVPLYIALGRHLNYIYVLDYAFHGRSHIGIIGPTTTSISIATKESKA